MTREMDNGDDMFVYRSHEVATTLHPDGTTTVVHRSQGPYALKRSASAARNQAENEWRRTQHHARETLAFPVANPGIFDNRRQEMAIQTMNTTKVFTVQQTSGTWTDV